MISMITKYPDVDSLTSQRFIESQGSIDHTSIESNIESSLSGQGQVHLHIHRYR